MLISCGAFPPRYDLPTAARVYASDLCHHRTTGSSPYTGYDTYDIEILQGLGPHAVSQLFLKAGLRQRRMVVMIVGSQVKHSRIPTRSKYHKVLAPCPYAVSQQSRMAG